MSADTTPAILVTDGAKGPEYRIAIAQAWEGVWHCDDEGEFLDSQYVVSVFERSPVVASTIEDARLALLRYIASTGQAIQYGEQILDLRVVRPITDLERHLGLTPAFTFRNLTDQANELQALTPSTQPA